MLPEPVWDTVTVYQQTKVQIPSYESCGCSYKISLNCQLYRSRWLQVVQGMFNYMTTDFSTIEMTEEQEIEAEGKNPCLAVSFR